MKAFVTEKLIPVRVLNLALSKSIGQGPILKEVARPSISGNEILVKVNAVALNPIDFKFADSIGPYGSRLGCDFAGTVSEVGSNTATSWKVGDRVAGMVYGGIYPDQGAFAEYLRTDSDLIWKIPDGMSDEEASSFGIPAVTAMLALHVYLGIPWPSHESPSAATSKGKELLLYSGSTAVGLFAAQLAKMAGLTVIATASPHSFDLVKSHGADHVFNYRSSTAIDEIREQFPNITMAIDCYSGGNSGDFCAQVLQISGGKVITLLPVKSKVKNVNLEMIMSFTVFGKAFQWLPPIGPSYSDTPANRVALARFYGLLSSLTKDKRIRSPPVKLYEGGFDGIIQGLEDYRQGNLSGTKAVVKLA